MNVLVFTFIGMVLYLVGESIGYHRGYRHGTDDVNDDWRKMGYHRDER